MHFTTTTLLSLLPLLTRATPLMSRQVGGTGQCGGFQNAIDHTAASDYALQLSNGQNAGLCQGFLDNLHGTCGLGIINWKCANNNGVTGISFTAPTTCLGSQIQNTVWVATLPHIPDVVCSWGSYDGDDGPDGNGWWDAVFEFIVEFGGDS